MKILISALTHTGCARPNNEDAVAVCTDVATHHWLHGDTQDSDGYHTLGQMMVIVADGLGGQNAGEVASQKAIDTFEQLLQPAADTGGNEAVQGALASIIEQADDTIFHHAQERPETQGMGTTVVACWLLPQVAHLAWCGDSRCYHFSPGRGLRQVTHDHSYVQQLIDKGEITRRKAFHHPDNHIITRGCGDIDCPSDPDFADVALQPGDMLMMCSDGLFGCCYDAEIELLLYRHYTHPTACRNALLQAALDAGAPDNVTVAIVSCIGDDDDKPKASLALRCRHLAKRVSFAFMRMCGLL